MPSSNARMKVNAKCVSSHSSLFHNYHCLSGSYFFLVVSPRPHLARHSSSPMSQARVIAGIPFYQSLSGLSSLVISEISRFCLCLISRSARRGSVLGYGSINSNVVYLYLIHLRLVSKQTGKIFYCTAVVPQYYSRILLAVIQHYSSKFTPRKGGYELSREKEDAQAGIIKPTFYVVLYCTDTAVLAAAQVNEKAIADRAARLQVRLITFDGIFFY